MKKLLIALAFLAVPALAGAQAVNPVGIAFDSVDHAQAIRYEVGFFIGAAANPTQTQNVPVASIGGSQAAGRTLLLARPVFGNFTAKLRLIALDAGSAEIASPWSNATAPFVFSPLAPAIRGLQ